MVQPLGDWRAVCGQVTRSPMTIRSHLMESAVLMTRSIGVPGKINFQIRISNNGLY